jgi:hypothetical protein
MHMLLPFAGAAAFAAIFAGTVAAPLLPLLALLRLWCRLC